jgi:hypothetical protein
MLERRAEHNNALQKVGTYAAVLVNGTEKTCYPNALYAFMHGFVRFPGLPKELRAEVYEWAMADTPYTIDIRNFWLNNFPTVCFATMEAMQIFVATRTIQVREVEDCNTVLMVMTSVRSGLQCIGKVELSGFANFDGISPEPSDDGDGDEYGDEEDDGEGYDGEDDGGEDEDGEENDGEKEYEEEDGGDASGHTDEEETNREQPTSPYMELLKCCPGLHTVILPAEAFLRSGALSDQKIIDRIVSYYRLEDLFHCDSLGTIVLTMYPEDRDVVQSSASLMGTWFKTEFKERTGRAVKVCVEYR